MQHAVDRFLHICKSECTVPNEHAGFSPILTRDFTPCKPHPAPILHICEQWGLKPSEVVMIGDMRDDMLCGRAAGCPTILLANEHNTEIQSQGMADFVIREIHEVAELLQQAQRTQLN